MGEGIHLCICRRRAEEGEVRRAVLNAKEDGGTVLSSSHAETINLTYVRNLRLQGVHKVSGGSMEPPTGSKVYTR